MKENFVLGGDGIKRFPPFDRFAQVRESAGKTLGALLDEFALLRARNISTLRSWNLDERQLALESRTTSGTSRRPRA